MSRKIQSKRIKGLLSNNERQSRFEDMDLALTTTKDASTQTDLQGMAQQQEPEAEKSYNKRTWKLKNDIGFKILGELDGTSTSCLINDSCLDFFARGKTMHLKMEFTLPGDIVKTVGE